MRYSTTQSRSTQLYCQYSDSSAHGRLCRQVANTASFGEQSVNDAYSSHMHGDLTDCILRHKNVRRLFFTPASSNGGWLMATLSLRLVQHLITTPIFLIPMVFVLLLAYSEASSSNFYLDHSNSNSRFTLGDSCYHGGSKAQFCQPDYQNLATGKRFSATSTCDVRELKDCGKINVITPKFDNDCSDCPFREEYLTDNFPYRKTCWASKSFQATNMSHVNLTISFKKKYIINYLSLMDCGEPLPDNLEIMKSVDHGVSWQRWHLFSRNCERDFGIQGKPNNFLSRVDSREIICTMLGDIERDEYGTGGTISFNTLLNRRRSSKQYDSDPLLIDWMTATDIKIVLRKLPDSQDFDRPVAFSNVEIGGRCFCNGHASRCIERDGRQVCDCKHGTEGADCERCRSFWVDIPWRRATTLRPSECKPCKCNKHSSNCRFSPQLYKTLGMSSGGECLNCRHHTTGYHCHECKKSFFRDSTKNESDKNVCKVCNCHPLGSLTNICDRATGNCRCRPGVVGDRCDHCKQGYTPAHINASPCKRTVFSELASLQSPTSRPIRKCAAHKCKSDHRKLTHLDYCLREWAFVVRVSGFQRQNRWIKVVTQIEQFFKCRNCVHVQTTFNFWIRRKNWRCRCPRMRSKHNYLIITQDRRHYAHVADLMLDKRSIVWEWEESLTHKIQRYENFLSYNHEGCKDCDCIIQKERELKNRQRQTKRAKHPKMKESRRGVNFQDKEKYILLDNEEKVKPFGKRISSLEAEAFDTSNYRTSFRKRGARLALKRSANRLTIPNHKVF